MASAAPPSYHSPGYKGSTRFTNVAPATLPPVVLGTGKYPNLLVDAAGTAHIVFTRDGGTSAPDAITYCSLQRGIKSCAPSGVVPNPQAPDPGQGLAFAGNFPAGNHDFEGAVPLAIGNQLFLVDRRFPDVFNTPASTTSDSNVFEWSSIDGGATITGPGQIGDNQIAGGAIAYGDPGSPSIGTISATETGGTFFQGSPAGQYTTAKAPLGTGDQAYDGALALDGTLPIAVFADLSGTVFVREWSGQGDVNDASTWSESSFPGFSPQIIGGGAGVFVLYSDSTVQGGNLQIRRIASGQPAGSPIPLGTSTSTPAIAEDASGRLTFAYTDGLGIEIRTSTDGIHFSAPELAATIPPGTTIAHLVAAATADGGGFVSFVQNPTGAEGVGAVIASAFGTQQATGKPGLGPLPGGGIGSSVGDQLATSTCTTAKFGIVDAEIKAGCFAHDPQDPNLDVSLGEVDINGLRIIPDAGVRIGIDPKLHTIDTTGSVKVVLSGPGIDITLWHGELHAKIPIAAAGYDLFDLHELTAPLVAGFPIDGDVDIKLINGGVQVPVSLKLPGYFGGVTGSATLQATISGGLQLSSVEFKVGDANFGGLELKNVDVSYTLQGNVWKGAATLNVPAGGSALSVSVSVEFDNGAYRSGSFDVGLPYPGVPLDLNDTPPQLYLTHGGLGLGLNPLTLSGTIGFGISPVSVPGTGGQHDYAFSLDGKLSVAFGNPVTITVGATGFLYKIQIAQATLTYKIPDQVTLTGSSGYDLGMIESKGTLSAIIDPQSNTFGGQIRSDIIIHLSKLGLSSLLPTNVLDGGDITIPSEAIAVNNSGFGVYIPAPGFSGFFGTIAYHWGDAVPEVYPFQDVTSQFTAGIPQAAGDRHRARAAAVTSFRVPPHSPTASIAVAGAGGAPSVVLIAPSGHEITPATTVGGGATVVALGDRTAGMTYVGINHPAAGRWTVQQASGSQIAIADVKYSIGESPPAVHASLAGSGFRRTLRYRATIPANVTVTFAERAGHLFHVIGRARRGAGTIQFTPAFGPPGRRQLVALVANGGVPLTSSVVAAFVAPRPPRPGRAGHLRVRAGRGAFTFSFTPPPNAARTLLVIVGSDGRHLQRIVSRPTRGGSVPVIGFNDRVTVTVIGLGPDGTPGPGATASARRAT